MCTVTIVPLADGFRLMCNRDEQHTRPAAQPPSWVHTSGTDALMPIDPQGGGSWIAVTGDGFTVTLLNRAMDDLPAPGEQKRSRGELVTSLVDVGMTMTGLVEHDSVPWEALPGQMVLGDDGEWRLRERRERLACTYTLQAVKGPVAVG